MKIKDSGISNIQLYTCYFRYDYAHGEKDEVKAFPWRLSVSIFKTLKMQNDLWFTR